jgi:hypothetical protein
LRHDQHGATRIRERQIHFSFCVLENAKVAHLACDVADIAGAIRFLDAGENQKASRNFTNHTVIDSNPGR